MTAAQARLRDARASKKDPDEIQRAQAALVAARLAATQARQTARMQGSGDPGDTGSTLSAHGATFDLYV